MFRMKNDSNDLIQLSKSDLKQTAKVLSRAFQEGPIYMHFIPNKEKREKNLHVIFESFVCYCMKHGKVYATSENLEGILTVVPSEAAKITSWKMIKCGAWKMIFKFGLNFIKQGNHIDKITSEMHERIAPGPHNYLWLIAVDPPEQGKGFAGKLLKFYLNKCEKENRPCYLETGKKENVPFYEHFGFEVVEKHYFEELDFTLWGLIWKNK